MSSPALARGCPTVLARAYDTALLDLDGVVNLGDEPVTHAAQAIADARALGMRMAFVTNNASRRPETVAERLQGFGVPANVGDVVTSAMAAATLLASHLDPGDAVLVVGGEGLRTAVRAAGLTVVSSADEAPLAVVQGYLPSTTWADLAEAAVAVNRGAWWVATNGDLTMPSARGPVPGNGALVAAVAAATGQTPVVAGKPQLPLHREAVQRTGAARPLVVGDRLDTDIEGAVTADTDSMLVLTGVTDIARLIAAAPGQRPTYISTDLRGLTTAHPPVQVQVEQERARASCRGWTVEVTDAVAQLRRSGTSHGPDRPGVADPGDDLDAVRALAVLAWSGCAWKEIHDPDTVLSRFGPSFR